MLQTTVRRRAVRRAVRTRCQMVGGEAFRLFGERVIDLSPRGVLVACHRPTEVGEDMFVSFALPGEPEVWLDAEAVVARVVEGQRWEDVGYCAGLDFTYLPKSDRHALLTRLAGYPPPVPRRRLKTARDRVTEKTWSDAVLVRPIVTLRDGWGRSSVPRGVFSS